MFTDNPNLIQLCEKSFVYNNFVPKDLVEKVVDFLLNNGCEVTTINLK